MPKPPRITEYPPIQGQLDRPAAKWVTQCELGRLFGLSSPQIRGHLQALGWRYPKQGVSQKALQSGFAKPIIRKQFDAVGAVIQEKVSGYRWNVEKVAPALVALGLTPLSRLDVLAHSLADGVAREMKNVLKDLKKKTGLPVKSLSQEQVAEGIKRWQWALGRARANLELVDESDRPAVLARLSGLLEAKGLLEEHAAAFLEAAGFLHTLREWEMVRALEKASQDLAPTRMTVRL